MNRANTALERAQAVTEARRAYREASLTVEQRLREQMKEELNQYRTTLDLRIREAVNAGASVAEVMRAYPTKDRRTILTSLERTNGMVTKTEAVEAGAQYTFAGGDLFVDYTNFGPQNISGQATFTFSKWDDDLYRLYALDNLWNDDYTEKNEVVAHLDDVTDGYYYDSAVAFLEKEVGNDEAS